MSKEKRRFVDIAHTESMKFALQAAADAARVAPIEITKLQAAIANGNQNLQSQDTVSDPLSVRNVEVLSFTAEARGIASAVPTRDCGYRQ